MGVQHVLLSNGETHYHWVTDLGNPVTILELPKPGELDSIRERITIDRSPLWNIVVDENFMRTRPMRYYQVDAVKAVQESARAGRLGFLLEMATGTGKTTVAAAICRLYFQAEVAQRILFLVDRDELYTQAIEDLNQALNGQYTVSGYRDRERRWSSPITVATVQALNAAVAQGEGLPPEWFQLVISDEAHRSISGPQTPGRVRCVQLRQSGTDCDPEAIPDDRQPGRHNLGSRTRGEGPPRYLLCVRSDAR